MVLPELAGSGEGAVLATRGVDGGESWFDLDSFSCLRLEVL